MKTNIASLPLDDVLLLAGALAHAAKGKKLHPRVAAALSEVGKARKIIVAARKVRDEARTVPAESGSQRVSTMAALAEARKRLKSLADFLGVLARLPRGEPDAETASQLYARAFPRDTSYLNGSVGKLVSGASTVMDLADDPAAQKNLKALGAERLADHATRAVKELTSAYNETACTAEPSSPDAASALGPHSHITRAIREYARLLGSASLLDPSVPMAELLAPLTRLEEARRRKATARPSVSPEGPAQDSAEDDAPPSLAA